MQMLRSLFFYILRGALGFILITTMSALATSLGQIPPENLDSLDDPFVMFFFRGTLIVWFATLFLACLSFTGLLDSVLPARVRQALDWSPVYAPIIYGALTYLWFSQLAG